MAGMSGMRLFVGVQRGHAHPLTALIDLVTTTRISGPYVLPAGIATHCLTVLAPEGTSIPMESWWRFDAVGPRPDNPLGRATWTPWDCPERDHISLWEVNLPTAHFGIARARAQSGTIYDVPRLAAQLVQALARAPNALRADICTGLVVDQLLACGGPALNMVSSMPDLLPERMAGLLQHNSTGAWLRPVTWT